MLGLLFAGAASIRLINASTGKGTVQEELRVGDHFGEVGAILGTAQPYEVVADVDSTAFLVRADVVQQLCSKVASFAHALAKKLSTRLVQSGVLALRARPVVTSTPAPTLTLTEASPSASASPAVARESDGGIRFQRVTVSEIPDSVARSLPPKLIQRFRMLPLALRGRSLTVGMVDPFDRTALAELRRVLSSVDPDVVAISLDDFNAALVQLKLESSTQQSQQRESVAASSIVYDVGDSEREADSPVRVIGNEVVNLASAILAAGMERGASDIHIQNAPSGMKVRFRTNGQLVDWDRYIPESFAKGLVARFKVVSGLDITERRLPQDGRIGIKVGNRNVDFRISTLPCIRGEQVVLRLFEAANMMRPLDQIFYHTGTLTSLREALDRPYGAVVVAGPTGSGKSSTLYASMNERRRVRPDTNIITVEDPIEYRLDGMTQVQVSSNLGLTFAKVLRASLRQDPDLIMVGEVRDEDTARIALEAAMTGHVLLTSLHANNAMAVLQRLENLGCSRSVIAQSLALVLVQRLARRLCAKCSTTAVPPPLLLESLSARGLADASAPVPLPRAVGCRDCDETGFHGRVPVIESLVLTDDVRTALMAGRPLVEVESIAHKGSGFTPFSQYASYLMSRGMINPPEALLAVAI